jgi:hypothetical protein
LEKKTNRDYLGYIEDNLSYNRKKKFTSRSPQSKKTAPIAPEFKIKVDNSFFKEFGSDK